MKNKKIIYYILIILMVFSIIFSVIIIFKTPTIISEKRITSVPEKKIELSKEKPIEQYFLVETENIKKINIYVGKVTEKTGNIKITVYDDHNKKLSSKKSKIKDLYTSSNNEFVMDNLDNINGKIIHVKIETINTSSIVTLYTNDEYYENQYIIYQGNKENKSIVMNYIGNKKHISLIVHCALIFCTSAILALFLRDEVIQERKDKHGKNKKK